MKPSAKPIAIVIAILAGLGSQAAIPSLIHYQGRLLSGTNLVNGTVGLVLGLYTNATGGSPLYVDFNAAVTVVDGLYATDLGDNTVAGDLATALSSGELWLDVQVNGVPLTPREPLASAPYALTTGPRGLQNVEAGDWPLVAGGLANGAFTNFATVGGGLSNFVSGTAGTVGGGQENGAPAAMATVGGGYFNGAFGYGSTVPGGVGNGAMADYSFAAGRGALATNAGSFVWGDSQAALIASTAGNQVTFRCAGGVRFTSGTNAALQMVSWSPGQAGWTFSSDRNLKENLQPVDAQEVLRRLCDLPLLEWNYKGYAVRHVGPMAQDFHARFDLGGSDTMLSEADAVGVALAAIQGLQQQIEQKTEENGALQRRLDALEQRMRDLEHPRN